MTKTVVVLLSMFAVVGSASAAVNYYKLDEEVFLTKYSGIHHSTEVRGGEGEYKALFGLEFAEGGDAPCYMRIWSRHLNNYETGKYVFDGCVENDSSLEKVQFTGTDTYIRGVQICTNNDGDRLKGARIYGATLNRSTGKLVNESGYKEFDRPNCNGNWKMAQYCPAGQIATRLRISYTVGTWGAAEIDGLALTCREVEPS